MQLSQGRPIFLPVAIRVVPAFGADITPPLFVVSKEALDLCRFEGPDGEINRKRCFDPTFSGGA